MKVTKGVARDLQPMVGSAEVGSGVVGMGKKVLLRLKRHPHSLDGDTTRRHTAKNAQKTRKMATFL